MRAALSIVRGAIIPAFTDPLSSIDFVTMPWCRPSLVDGTMYPTDRVKITCTCDMADGAVVVALKAYRDADQSG